MSHSWVLNEWWGPIHWGMYPVQKSDEKTNRGFTVGKNNEHHGHAAHSWQRSGASRQSCISPQHCPTVRGWGPTHATLLSLSLASFPCKSWPPSARYAKNTQEGRQGLLKEGVGGRRWGICIGNDCRHIWSKCKIWHLSVCYAVERWSCQLQMGQEAVVFLLRVNKMRVKF